MLAFRIILGYSPRDDLLFLNWKPQDEGMSISLKSITALLKSQNLDFSVSGNALSVERLLTIAPQVKDALFYYVEDDPNALNGVKSFIIFCKSELKQECT
jgi:hypothetical protein